MQAQLRVWCLCMCVTALQQMQQLLPAVLQRRCWPCGLAQPSKGFAAMQSRQTSVKLRLKTHWVSIQCRSQPCLAWHEPCHPVTYCCSALHHHQQAVMLPEHQLLWAAAPPVLLL